MTKRVVIIGGGYGGLASAALFAASGYDVTVLEKNRQLGGRAGEIRQDGFRFDTGPSWYLMPEIFEAFYGLFGRSAQNELDLLRLSPAYKVFFPNDTAITIRGELAHDAQQFDAIETGAGKMLQHYVQAGQRIYDLSLDFILANTYQQKRWILAPNVLRALPLLARLAPTSLHSYVAQHFRDTRLQRILEYQSVFLGTSPYAAPAIYSLMSTLDFDSGVYFPRRGMYSLIESMQVIGTAHGVTYQTGAAVQEIMVQDGAASGVILTDGSTVAADIVISGADLHHTETQLLTPAHRSFPEPYWQKRQPGPSALLISLGIKGSLPALEHHNLYFVEAWRENFEAIYDTHDLPTNPSIYICKPSATDPTAAPEGHENIFILVPLPSGKALLDTEISQLRDLAINRLANIANVPDIAERIVTRHISTPQDFGSQFNAWQYNALGGAAHTLRQSAFFRTPNRSRKIKNLYYVGAGTNPGIGLPMCLLSAQVVYKMVHGIYDTGLLTNLQEPQR